MINKTKQKKAFNCIKSVQQQQQQQKDVNNLMFC